MGICLGIGFSKDIDPVKAAKEAAGQAKAKLVKDRVDLVIIFSSIHYDPAKTAPIIRETIGQKKIIGCSTAGIILSHGIELRGIAVLVLHSDDIQFGIGSVQNVNPNDIRQAGNLLARNCVMDFAQPKRSIFLFFPDGLIKDKSLFLKGVQEVVGNLFPIVGAGSSDNFHFKQTFQIYQTKALNNSAAGVLIGGAIHVGVGGRHGWRPLGKPRLTTHVDNHIIRTIDNKRASTLYEEYFGETVENLKNHLLNQVSILYPLGIHIEGSTEYLLRNAVDILTDGSIVCQGEVPENAEVHIMIGNKDYCKHAALDAALEAREGLLGRTAQLIIVIESMSRLKLLGRMAFEEIQKIKEAFGLNTPLIGLYAHGEISPFEGLEKVKKPHLQNESIVVLALG